LRRDAAKQGRDHWAIIIAAFWQAATMPFASIESLDNEGRGVAHVDGKVIFIEGALPGELVEYSSYRKKPKFERAQTLKVVKASSQRVVPGCPHFGVCGGCSMQHLESGAQTAAKQRVLEDALWHLARLKPDQVYAPISGSAWGYRRRARLSVRHVAAKGGVLVGFHEKRSSYVAAMNSCAVLPPAISTLIPALKELIEGMSTPDRLPQIELAIGDQQCALVLRNLAPLSAADEARVREFADRHTVTFYLQPGGLDTVTLFHPPRALPLQYRLPDFGISLRFRPTDFTQVNHGINRMLVRRAMHLLRPEPGERIGDLFCGLGNFTLPIAALGANVVGVEGSDPLVERARANAELNGLAERCDFHVANLFEATEDSLASLGAFDKLLVDPPREGAIAVVNALGAVFPRRIVYVSCNPATLARDAAVLVHGKGYVLRGAGIASMFPHTSHVESIALFEHA
jgi:23S rRNA (uracil1939-C5)-methyltransferase